jgi:hypothetical protein
MFADAVDLNNPESSERLALFQAADQGLHTGIQVKKCGPAWRPQDYDSGIALWRKAQRIRKIEVERDQATRLSQAMAYELRIGRPNELFILWGRNIMTRRAE